MVSQEILKPILESFSWFNYRGIDFFHEWLTTIIYALSGEEEKYMSIVNNYLSKNQKEVIDKYAQMFGQLRVALEKTNSDILGTLYEIEASRSKRGSMGQFFTPEHICEMMAKMQIGNDNLRENNLVGDPCCGSGRMLLYAFKSGVSGTYIAQDLDIICTKMCALNFCFFNMNGIVLNGNSLVNEVNFGYITTGSILGGSIRELTLEEIEYIKQVKLNQFQKTETAGIIKIPISKKSEIDSSIRSLF